MLSLLAFSWGGGGAAIWKATSKVPILKSLSAGNASWNIAFFDGWGCEMVQKSSYRWLEQINININDKNQEQSIYDMKRWCWTYIWHIFVKWPLMYKCSLSSNCTFENSINKVFEIALTFKPGNYRKKTGITVKPFITTHIIIHATAVWIWSRPFNSTHQLYRR